MRILFIFCLLWCFNKAIAGNHLTASQMRVVSHEQLQNLLVPIADPGNQSIESACEAQENGGGYVAGTIMNPAIGVTVNAQRSCYTFNKTTASTGYDETTFEPINEKAAFNTHESPFVWCIMTEITCGIEMGVQFLGINDSIIIDFLDTIPAPPQGFYYPKYPLIYSGRLAYMFYDEALWNLNGAMKVRFYSRRLGTTTNPLLESNFSYTYRFILTPQLYDGANPNVSSASMANDVNITTGDMTNPNTFDFYTDDNKAFVWTQLKNVAEPCTIAFDWYGPNDSLYFSDSMVTSTLPYNKYYDKLKVWSSIDIENSPAATMPGEWTVICYTYFYRTQTATNDTFGIFDEFWVPQFQANFNITNAVRVWPGDANNDGLVAINDFFLTASGYGKSGDLRGMQGVNWQGYLAPTDWPSVSTFQGNEINNKYLDANGDGEINLFDIAATIFNRGQIH